MSCIMDSLVGKFIREVRIDVDKDMIVFNTDQGWWGFHTEGDCCSSTTIYHVEMGDIIGAKVVGARDIEMPDDLDEQEWTNIYGIQLDLEGKRGGRRSPFRLEFRNNGAPYYGGSLAALKPLTFAEGIEKWVPCTRELKEDF